jgi:LysR family glycine cleavage system transcriptional activator
MSKQAPLTWLRSFEASARSSSFTRAAEELNITQAAVSKQIKALESQLNCQLFKRHAHGLSLTEQGRRYWLDTRELIQQLDTVTQRFLTGNQSNKVHIRCNISYSMLVLTPLLKTFKKAYPDIAIELTHDIWEPDKPSSNAHIEIGYGRIEKQTENKYQKLLASDQLFPVISPVHSETDIETLPLIHVSGFYQEWNWWVDQLKYEPDDGVMGKVLANLKRSQGRQDWSVDNSMMAYQLAEQGVGIALARTHLVDKHIQQNRLRRLSAHLEFPSPEGFYLTLNDLGIQHVAAKRLFNHLMPMSAERI